MKLFQRVTLPDMLYEPFPYVAMLTGALTPIFGNGLLVMVGIGLTVYGMVMFGRRVEYRERWR